MIRHTVMFTPKHRPGSAEERALLSAACELAKISTVRRFEVLRQISPKCNHRFGLSMEFDDEPSYHFYNEHADHVAFVNDRWKLEVESWQEIDYVLYDD